MIFTYLKSLENKFIFLAAGHRRRQLQEPVKVKKKFVSLYPWFPPFLLSFTQYLPFLDCFRLWFSICSISIAQHQHCSALLTSALLIIAKHCSALLNISVAQHCLALPGISQHSQHCVKFSLYQQRRNEQHVQSCLEKFLTWHRFLLNLL